MNDPNRTASSSTLGEHGVFVKSMLAAAVSGVLVSPAWANPTGPQVVRGNVGIVPGAPGELNITNTPGAIINWEGFSISSGELTRFIQQNGASAVLNRVIGASPSDIRGSLLSNGKVFLINRNGIVFGEHAIIDTAGFVASTLNISDADFIAGRMAFSGEGGTLENRGFIRVREGGEVMLIAPDVTNTGLIRADDGAVLLAAGRDIVIESMDFEHVRFRVQAPDDQVLNLGRIVSTGGVVALFAGTLRHDGVIEANRLSRDAQGRVRLQASGDVSVGGQITATGQGARGGDVTVTGAKVVLAAAGIDVSGDNGGGRARIGGDYQGGGDLSRSRSTRLDAGSRVSADARVAGDGGEIIVWSDGDTDTRAQLSARGGPAGGDGGLVETSGRGSLSFGPPADVSAPAGKGGTWLLDPEDIDIGSGEAESISTALNSGSNVSVKTSDDGDGEGNISVNAPISKTEGDDAALSMDAHNRIDVNAPITSTAGKLDVSLKAGRKVHLNADVKTNGGDFSQVVTGDYPEPEAPDEAFEESTEPPEAASEPSSDEIAEASGGDDESAASSSGDEGVQGDAAPTQNDTAGTETSSGPSADAANSVVAESGTTAPTEAPSPGGIEAPEIVEELSVAVDETATTETIPDSGIDGSTADATASGEADDATAAFKEDLEILVEGSIDTDGGDIFIDAGRDGTTGIFGDVDASSESDTGGNIQILGKRVGIYDDAVVDASGKTGGGTVLVGGDQQGKNPDVPNASAVYVGADATIRADATGNGDGGRVIVYADHTANILGRLSARGGPEGGDGGFVETSGRINLSVRHAPDTRAPAGNAGTWLIDPTDITIVSGGADNNVAYVDNATYYDFYATGNGAQLGVDTIFYGLYYAGTVRIHTTYDGAYDADDAGNITWEGDAALDVDGIGYETLGNLYLYADNDINFYGSIYTNDLSYGGIGNLKFIADNDGEGNGSVNILGSEGGARIEIEGDFEATGAAFNAIAGDDENESVEIDVGGQMFIDADAGDVDISGGTANLASVFLFSRDNMTIRGENVRVLGGTGEAAYANVVMSGYTEATAGPFPELTQHIEATDGNIEVLGGEGEFSRAQIFAYQYVDAYENTLPDAPVPIGATLEQVLTATGDITVAGGDGDGSYARVELLQTSGDYKYEYFYVGARFHESFDIDTGNEPGDFAFTLNATQTLDAGGNINVLGGDIEAASASVQFSQFGYVDLFSPTTDSTLAVTFDGGQFVDAAGDVNVQSGQVLGSYAIIDPRVSLTVKYSSSSEGGTVTTQVNTYQRVRAGYGGGNDGSLNITAVGDDASVSTGGYFYESTTVYYVPVLRAEFGTDQVIEADGLNIVSETTSGVTAQIALDDGSSLEGYENPGFNQTINIGGDALLRSANGGVGGWRRDLETCAARPGIDFGASFLEQAS